MTTLTVTATQGGATQNGMALRVFVLTGAAAVAAQTGAATNNQFASATTWTQSITTTAGSNVYGTASHGGSITDTASNSTIVDSINDATNGETYVTFKALNVTSGATSRGFTTNLATSGPFAQLEVLATGTLAEDASSPAVVSTTSAQTVTTASFTPPPGSLLVALVPSDGGTGSSTTMSVTDNLGTHLNWTEKVKNNPSSGDYAGVWIADVPAAAAGAASAQPGRTWLRRFHHPQQLLPPAAVAAAAAPAAPQVLLPQHRNIPPGRARLGSAGALAAGILAVTTLSPQPSAVPPARPAPSIAHPAPHRAVFRRAIVPPQLPFLTAKLPPTAISPRPPHRAVARWVLAVTTLSPQPSSVPAPLWRQPVAPRPAHRAIWRQIAGPAPAAVAVTAVPPARPQPVINRPPAPHRATGKGILATTTLSPQPSRVPPPQWRQPFAPRPPHRAVWRVIASAPPAVVAVTSVPPSRPAPVTNRPPAPHRAITRRITGAAAPLAPPSRPLPVINRPPAPHRAVARWVLAKTTLSAQPARVPGPQWRQPFAPRPPHRAIWRAVAGAAPPPPPFTIGALTAATTSLAALTTADARGGSSAGTLTASDQRTGGPGG